MPKKGSFLRELPIIVVSALIVSIVIKTFFLHFFYIPSGSMENTLQIGDRIAVNKFGALFSEIKRGEVVVFGDPDNWLGEASESNDSAFIGKIKSALIMVGVIPDPAKQYLIKRVIGVGGDNDSRLPNKTKPIGGLAKAFSEVGQSILSPVMKKVLA